MGQQENTAGQHELESLVEPPSYEEGSSCPQAQCPSPEQKQKVIVKFMLCTRWRVTEYNAEFWMAPSTTLQEACDIANQMFVRDLSVPDENAFHRLVRNVGEWSAIESSQNHFSFIFVRPRVLAGDLHQTVGDATSEDTYLYLSNSIDCFHVQDRALLMIPMMAPLGIFLLVLIMIIVDKSRR